MDSAQELAFNLEKQRWLDMCKSTWNAIFMLPLFWLVIAFWLGIDKTHKVAFYINTFVFLVGSFIRFYLIRLSKSESYQYKIDTLTKVTFFSGCHWGLVFAWLLYGIDTSLTQHYALIVMLVALGLIGASHNHTFGNISTIYLFLLTTPAVTIATRLKPEHYHFFVGMYFILLAYTYSHSKFARNNYELSLIHRINLANHAQTALNLSRTDYLTKLGNRFYFMDNYEQLWQKSLESNQPLSLIFAHINFLKDINQTYGHSAGDEVIKQVANTMKKAIEAPHVIARYGGDEFAIALLNKDSNTATEISSQIQSAISEIAFSQEGSDIPCTCSFGLISTTPKLEDDAASFLESARQSLHQANKHGNASLQKLNALKVFDMYSSQEL